MKKIVAIEDTISLRRKRKNGKKRPKPRVCTAKKKGKKIVANDDMISTAKRKKSPFMEKTEEKDPN